MKKHSEFKQKVVLVTGSARGLGKSIAREFGKNGGTIIICDIDKTKGDATAKEFCQNQIDAHFIFTDLSEESSSQKLIQKIVKNFGQIDILVNNARSGKRVDFIKETEESWEETMAVTLKAVFFTSQSAILEMGKTGGGKIVNIASVEAEVVSRGSPSYHIAKAGIVQMTRYLAVYAGKFKVNVNCVAPGFIIQDEHIEKYNKPKNKKYRKITEFVHPMGSPGFAKNTAESVLFLCSTQAEFINGQCLFVDGGLLLQEQSKLLYDFEKYK